MGEIRVFKPESCTQWAVNTSSADSPQYPMEIKTPVSCRLFVVVFGVGVWGSVGTAVSIRAKWPAVLANEESESSRELSWDCSSTRVAWQAVLVNEVSESSGALSTLARRGRRHDLPLTTKVVSHETKNLTSRGEGTTSP